jgi:uncharacterized protein YbcV (DUF1398 family)
MNADAVNTLAKATLDGSMPFPQIVGKLMAEGVAYYHVDFAALSFTFYSAAGSTVAASLTFEGLPSVSADFDAVALKDAIVDSQQHGQKFRQFCERAMRAGVQGYFAFLLGKRVMYLGKKGDQHIEWFPGAKPAEP